MINSTIKVSVIVPVYNVEQYLGKCLDSLVNQTLDNAEIIVVNDGSTDFSENIIKEYQAKCPAIKYISKENGGLSSARNTGIAAATGEYIGFVDADDYVDRDMLRLMYESAAAENAEVCVCAYYRCDEKSGNVKSPSLHIEAPYNKKYDSDYALFDLSPYAWNKLFRRDLIMKSDIRFPEGCVYEDIPTVYPWMSLANKITVVDKPLYYYRTNREGSIMAESFMNNIEMLTSLRSLNSYFNDLGVSREGYDKLCALNIRHIYYRLNEFRTFRSRKIKLNFVDNAFNLLDNTFPEWRKNAYFNKYKSGVKSRLKKELMTSELFWKAYINTLG